MVLFISFFLFLEKFLTSKLGSIFNALYNVKSNNFLYAGIPKSQIACVPNSSKNLSLPSNSSPVMYEPAS